MTVIPDGLRAREFRAYLQRYIDANGLAAAFLDDGLVVLYSGPSKAVVQRIKKIAARKKLIADFRSNWNHSRNQARDLDGKRIDDTDVGNQLAITDTDVYFARVYKTRKSVIRASFSVWALASREFMKARFHAVATSVCGADPNRVFRKVELRHLLQNPHVQHINNRPIQLFRDFFNIDDYETFRLFCITELLEARKYAMTINTPEAWKSYSERRQFFVTERQMMFEKTPALSPDAKAELALRKRRILAIYSLPKIAGFPSVAPTPPTPHIAPARTARRAGHGAA